MSDEFGFKVTELVQKRAFFEWYLTAGNTEVADLHLKQTN